MFDAYGYKGVGTVLGDVVAVLPHFRKPKLILLYQPKKVKNTSLETNTCS